MDIPRHSAVPVFPPQPTIQADEEIIETLKENLESATPIERKLVSALVPITGSVLNAIQHPSFITS